MKPHFKITHLPLLYQGFNSIKISWPQNSDMLIKKEVILELIEKKNQNLRITLNKTKLKDLFEYFMKV